MIDSNRAIAGLLKDSTTREILFDKTFEFVAPEYIAEEIFKHHSTTVKKSGLTEKEFRILLALVVENISIIPYSGYKEFIPKMGAEIKDPKDVPYLAVCLATNAEGIWTHDLHFREQKKAKVFTNIDLLRLSGKAKTNP